MSRTQEAVDMSSSGAQATTIQDIAEELRQVKQENQELRERVENLEQDNTTESLVEVRGVDSPDEASIDDVWLAGEPLGKILQNTKSRSYNNQSRIDDLENGDVDAANAATVDRSKLLPIHKMWIDLKNGDEHNIQNNSYRRGARLFARFIRKAAGEQSVGVDATYGTYTMTQPKGRDLLLDDGDMTKGGYSKTTERAMKAVQRGTRVEDCDCGSIEDCDHGLVVFDQTEGTNKLVADKDEFNAAMQNVQAAIEGDVSHDSTADDDAEQASSGTADEAHETARASNSDDEDGEDSMAELEQLRDASPVEDSDTVVSTHDGVASDGGEPRTT